MGECTRSKAKNVFASEPHIHEAGRAGLQLTVALALLAACRTPEPATPRTDGFEAEAKEPRRAETFEAKTKADPGGGPNAESALPASVVAAPLANGQIDRGPGVEVEVVCFGGRAPSGPSAFDAAVSPGADYAKGSYGNENDPSIGLEISLGDFELLTPGGLSGTDDEQAHPLYVRRDWGSKRT